MTQTTKLYKGSICLPDQVVIIWDWGNPTTVLQSNNRFERIKEMLDSYDDDYLQSNNRLLEEVDLAFSLDSKLRGKFAVVGGIIKIGDEMLPGALSDMLLKFVEKDLDTTPLENFWDNLKENPAESARQDLFSYLKANKAPLTRDGHFIAYKKVREDFWDTHTGRTHQNLPGSTISMDRDKVEPDRRKTCAPGLHVAAWDYAQDFGGTKLLLIKVNPRDVVAVPPDYDEQKMRVCQYLVLGETDKPYDRSIYEEALINEKPSSEVQGDIVEVDDDYEDDYEDDYGCHYDDYDEEDDY